MIRGPRSRPGGRAAKKRGNFSRDRVLEADAAWFECECECECEDEDVNEYVNGDNGTDSTKLNRPPAGLS